VDDLGKEKRGLEERSEKTWVRQAVILEKVIQEFHHTLPLYNRFPSAQLEIPQVDFLSEVFSQ
jgi:hypothetical protein